MDSGKGQAIPGGLDSVFVLAPPEEDLSHFLIPLHQVDGNPVNHRLFYFRFFPEGRVLFSSLPVDDAAAAGVMRDGKIAIPSLDVDFDKQMAGDVGRYECDGSAVRIELFTVGFARWGSGGTAYHYLLHEGVLEPDGFTLTRISSRHWCSADDRVHDVDWRAFRVPVSRPLEARADW